MAAAIERLIQQPLAGDPGGSGEDWQLGPDWTEIAASPIAASARALQTGGTEAGAPLITDRTPQAHVRPSINARQFRPLLAGFFGIMDRWHVDNATARVILGEPAESTFYKWKAGEVGAVPVDTIRRIGYVSGIWKALEILYSDAEQADTWVNRPNRFFNGHTPLARMRAGDVTDLAAVRQYLDAARAPW